MLVLFRFKNYGPFKDEAVFDMRAVRAYKEHPYNLIHIDGEDSLLKVVAIYGANASGKSNFVDAYYYFRRIVRDSFSNNDKEDSESVLAKYYYPFFFDDESCECDTEFEAVYIFDECEYKYGFVYNNNRIKYEWLYKKSLATNRQSCVFERTSEKITLGYSVKKTCEKYVSDIDSSVLVLSFFSSLKLQTSVFKKVAYCIFDILPVYMSSDKPSDMMLSHYFAKDFDEEEKTRLLSFLHAIDVGIKDISVERNKDSVMVFTQHDGKDGEHYRLPLDLESDGTKRAIAIYSFIRVAVLYDKGLIIDELNNQLHPLLQKYIIDLMYDQSAKGQLIYTTHDTSLLDKRFMRRDQIWFTSKNESGESSIYSLAEFKIRNDKSFGQDYLAGIYGGIPILKEFSFKEEQDGN